jgi:hypothetical protein
MAGSACFVHHLEMSSMGPRKPHAEPRRNCSASLAPHGSMTHIALTNTSLLLGMFRFKLGDNWLCIPLTMGHRRSLSSAIRQRLQA